MGTQVLTFITWKYMILNPLVLQGCHLQIMTGLSVLVLKECSILPASHAPLQASEG
jgi:hypothetical protein